MDLAQGSTAVNFVREVFFIFKPVKMKNNAALRYIGILVFLVSCALPVAVAKADKMIWLPTDSVVLNGTGSSDNHQDKLQYRWSQVYGPGPAQIAHSGIAPPLPSKWR